jgi:uncharacterized membrane protein YcjF (UPF0283 family)
MVGPVGLSNRLSENQKRFVAKWGLTAILAVGVVLSYAVILWINQWWHAGWLGDLVEWITGS